MDPTETLRRLKNAVEDGAWREAVGALNDYYQWRVKGGFHGLSCDRIGETGDQCADRLANRMQDYMS